MFIYALLLFSDSASHDDCEELSSLLPDTENKQGEKEASVVPQEGHLTEKPPRCKMVKYSQSVH